MEIDWLSSWRILGPPGKLLYILLAVLVVAVAVKAMRVVLFPDKPAKLQQFGAWLRHSANAYGLLTCLYMAWGASWMLHSLAYSYERSLREAMAFHCATLTIPFAAAFVLFTTGWGVARLSAVWQRRESRCAERISP